VAEPCVDNFSSRIRGVRPLEPGDGNPGAELNSASTVDDSDQGYGIKVPERDELSTSDHNPIREFRGWTQSTLIRELLGAEKLKSEERIESMCSIQLHDGPSKASSDLWSRAIDS
jgi:hypothetical protein